MTIAYRIGESLYLNITNRCTNSCIFCAKFSHATLKGYQLKLDHEPTAAEVKRACGDPDRYAEIVFCGYGEPLLRLELVKDVSRWLKEQGAKVRINTDGQANLVHQRNILPELAGIVDAISISLNAPDPDTYRRICPSTYNAVTAYRAVKDFIVLAQHDIPAVTATAVAYPGVDIAACNKVAAELGVPFRSRAFHPPG